MEEITHLRIFNYMKSLADNNVHINGFYRIDITEIEGSIRSGISYPVMAMESHEGNFEGSSSHNSIESKSFAFSIMSKTQAGDYDGQNSVLDQAEIIGKQVLARIRLDATDPTHILYKLFDIARVSFHKIGPIYVDQLYGYRFEIPLKPNKVLAKVSPDDWTDIDEVC